MVGTFLILFVMAIVPARALRRKPKPEQLINSRIRGNWCYGDCLTRFEKQYLRNHSATLKVGLQALRRPGCVSPGKRIITASMYRSGSTLLFNQARLWMNLAFPGNISQGYEPSFKQYSSEGYAAVIAKVHFLRSFAAEADVVLTTRRSIVDTLITRLDVLLKVDDPSMVNQTEALETLKLECKLAMTIQDSIYTNREKAGGVVSYDLLLKHYEETPTREILNVARSLGVCQEAYENHNLTDFVQELGNYLLRSPGIDNKITQMHKPMAKERKNKWRPVIQELIKKDSVCNKWAADNAQLKSNMLHKKKKQMQ